MLNLVRTGGFLVRADGGEHFLDPTVANFEWPGQELYVSHPLGLRAGDADRPARWARRR